MTPAKLARKIEVLRATNLAKIPWLVHGFSTRTGGCSSAYGGRALNLGYTPEDTRATVDRNRAAFMEAVGATSKVTGRTKRAAKETSMSQERWPLVWLRQVHSDVIHLIERVPEHTLTGDGLITETPGILLAIRTADCLPILIADPKKRAVAALHAGWRPTLKRMAEKGVGEMRRWFGSRPEDLQVSIGPGIHGCCYEVGEEVREQFHSQFEYADALFTETKDADEIHDRYPLLFLVQRAPGHIEPHLPVKIRLDLVEANRRQLLAAGVKPRSITASPLCTACRKDVLFSHRAEHGKTGRMMGVIGIR